MEALVPFTTTDTTTYDGDDDYDDDDNNNIFITLYTRQTHDRNYCSKTYRLSFLQYDFECMEFQLIKICSMSGLK
jgi:hypothetical protein